MKTSDLNAAQHPFLSGMSDSHLSILAKSATRVHFQADTPIFREGAAADRPYLIQTGKVSLQTHSGGHPVRIAIVGAGEALGWSWLFPPYFWHFEAWACESVDAIVFDAAQLRKDCEQDKTLGYELMKRVAETLVHRLHATRLKLVQSMKREHGSGLPNEA